MVEQSLHGRTCRQRNQFLLAAKDVSENTEIKHAYLHQEQNTLRVRRWQGGFACRDCAGLLRTPRNDLHGTMEKSTRSTLLVVLPSRSHEYHKLLPHS